MITLLRRATVRSTGTLYGASSMRNELQQLAVILTDRHKKKTISRKVEIGDITYANNELLATPKRPWDLTYLNEPISCLIIGTWDGSIPGIFTIENSPIKYKIGIQKELVLTDLQIEGIKNAHSLKDLFNLRLRIFHIEYTNSVDIKSPKVSIHVTD